MTANLSRSNELSLWGIIKPVKEKIYIGMILSALSGVAWIIALVLLHPITTELLSESPNVNRLWLLGGAVLFTLVIGFILRILSFRWSHIGAFELEEILRTNLASHLAKVPLGYVVTTGSGKLKKILMDDVMSLHAFVADSTPLMARAYVTPILILVVMFLIDWRMALVSIAIFPIGLVAMRFAFTDYEEGREAYDAANEHINQTIVEYVQGMQVVRTFDDGTSSFTRYSDALTTATKTMREWASQTRYGAFVARIMFASLPTLVIVLPTGIWMLQNGWIDVPTLLLFIFLAPTLAENIIPLIWLSQLIIMSQAGAKRIGTLLSEPILTEVEMSQKPANATIEFKNVTFTYAERKDPALKDVSFTVEEGTVTALVGPSGAGKSTVAQLIPRFWDVSEGRITIGGVDVRHIKSDDLMKHVSFVFQIPFLLQDTIRENIRLGKPEATDEEIIEAAKAAQAHDFIINELDHGYDTKAGERGTRLSGGQRQRITIARAILQDSPIIVLDEATAFADPENEAKIHAAIANLTKGKTLIVVAHRLSTIRDAHQIVVLDHGAVVEKGVHDTLVENNGVYARLWAKFKDAQGWGLRRNQTDEKDKRAEEIIVNDTINVPEPLEGS
ncbi:MAG: ABC transporter ATP-binding protein [Chloroflexota bacterium]